jgi:hypothetical protein
MSKFIILAPVLVGIVVFFVACRKSSSGLVVGGIYSTADSEGGGFRVVKLLVHEDGICHIRIYKQKFQSRPTTIDFGSLSLGKPGDSDGFGMGHIPVRETGFLTWQPVFITNTAVTPEELEGYKIWKESSGGVF